MSVYSPRSDPVRIISYFLNGDTDHDNNEKPNDTNFAIVTSRGVRRFALPPPKRSSSFGSYYSANRESPLYPIPIVDSLDAPCDSSVWKAQLPTNTSKIRQLIERRYYQYEVTWGLYVLSPGEKVVINSMVLIMFSLISYTLTDIAIFHRMIMHGVSVAVGMSYSTLQPL